MPWLDKSTAIANKKKVSERRTTDEKREGYWYNGEFIETAHKARPRLVVVERYPAMTLAAAEDLVNDWDADATVEGQLQERNEAACYDVIKTTTTVGSWEDV